MSFSSMFKTWDEVADYITNTKGIDYFSDPTSWTDAFKQEVKGYKYVTVVNDVTGETTGEFVPADMVSGVGEWHVGENYSGPQTIGSTGGAKSVPKAKTVITNNSTQTAVLTEEATGVKDNGVLSGVKGINIISGILAIYGLVHAGIKIANMQVWKDMSNYVFNSNFTEDTPIERVVDFLKMKIVNTVTDVTSDGELIIEIPESIARRMYTFIANHVIAEQIPEINPSLEYMDTLYNFIHRTFEFTDSNANLDRYFSVTNPTELSQVLKIIDVSDDVFKYCVQDVIQSLIGLGYNITDSVSLALLASINGVYEYLFEQSIGAVQNYKFCDINIRLQRGSTPPPMTTPISLSEFIITITCFDLSTAIPIHEEGEYKYVNHNTNLYLGVSLPTLATGYSYTYGDCVKYLKRGRTGADPNDYGYALNLLPEVPQSSPRSGVQITYPSNEKHYTYISGRGRRHPWYTNGYTYNDTRNNDNNRPSWEFFYSNLGLEGYGTSYHPDDYLTTAGFRSKKDSSGGNEKMPDPTKSMEEQYPQTNNKKQQANSTTDESGNVINYITYYIPASVPQGSENADRLIDHGMNNSNDPQSYVDDRSQEDKLDGKVNRNDPVDGFNEDTNRAIDDYNDSRKTPESYPDPLPENYPNPQYPTNPPTDNDGDSGDTPTVPQIGGLTASGMVSVYNPTKQQLIDFSSWLWSGNFFDNFIKLFANPMDAIIGLHMIYATPISSGSEHIIVGYLDSDVSSKVVTQQYFKVDCGTINIPEYYGNATDYEPYTTIHIYLPFIGIVPLKTNDVLGKQLHLEYGVDVMTGTCLAMLTTIKGDSKIMCYTFAGNCAVQIPISGGNYAQMITGLAGFIVGGVGAIATGNPVMALGAGASFLHGNVNVQHSGSIGSNAGACGTRIPYVLVTRKVAYDAQNYQHYYGFPSNNHVTLGTCKGYTQVKSCHVETIGRATDNEKTEIETLLKNGIIIV